MYYKIKSCCAKFSLFFSVRNNYSITLEICIRHLHRNIRHFIHSNSFLFRLNESQGALTQNSIEITSDRKMFIKSDDYYAIKKREGRMSWVAEPLFLNRGAIATPKSRPTRTWTGISVLYLSYTKYRRRWAACILRTRT